MSGCVFDTPDAMINVSFCTLRI
eukprot:COSAG02_NODE_59761_length_273_cov_0.666667_1_plen_22_part_01